MSTLRIRYKENEMENVKIVELGLGDVVSSYGTFEGKPAVFLEPVKMLGFQTGQPGTTAPDTPRDSVVPGTVILRINASEGAHVVMEDLVSAMTSHLR
jgi:hypothetical protein